MKKLLLIPLLLFCVTAFGQWTKPQLYSNINTNIRLKTYSPTRMAALLDSLVATMNTGGGGGAFTDLSDVPNSYSGQGSKLLRVNAGATALEYFTPSYLTALSNGNGTTANGSAVDLGGTASGNISIDLDGHDFELIGSDLNVKFFEDDGYAFAIESATAVLRSRASSVGVYSTTGDNAKSVINSDGSAQFEGDGTGLLSLQISDGQLYSMGITNTGDFNSTGVVNLQLGSDAAGDLYRRNSANTAQERIPVGTNTHVLTLVAGVPSWAAPSGGGLTVGTSTITGGTNGYGFYNNSGVLGEFAYGTGVRTFLTTPSWTNFQSAITGTSPYLPLTGATYTTTTGDGLALTTSTLTSGNLVSLTSTSTAAASNTNTLLNISSSGSNATSTQTVTGAKISVTNTGTSATNDALTVSSSGGTTNNAIKVSGGNILLTQAANQSILKSGGILTVGVSDYNTLALAVQNTNRITINGSSGAFTFITNTVSSGAITPYSFNDVARTNQTASTETNFVNWTPNTTQYATGAQTILRTYRMNPAAYSFVGASTITDAYTLWVDDPVASTNATITNNWAAGFQGNVQITGNLGNTSSRVTKGWFTDLEVTNPIPGTIGGSTGLTDNAIPRANGTGGSTLQSSGVTIDDYDVITASGFKQGSFSSGGTSYQTQQASLGGYGASSTGFIGLSNSSDYANNTVLYVEFTAVLMKSDGTASVSATVQSRFRKNNSGTWIADSAGTAVTSDATVMTTLVGDINGGVPGITWTSGAFAGTYAGGFSSKITAYIY